MLEKTSKVNEKEGEQGGEDDRVHECGGMIG